jgi:hypothetical protein
MAISLAIGVNADGEHPADALIHHFQICNSRITASERTLFGARATAPRMSVNANLCGDFAGANRDVYSRGAIEPVLDLGVETTSALAAGTEVYQPTRVSVFQKNGVGDTHNHTFFIDNISLFVSGIYWEFSPDDGANWYGMKDIMNESRSRFVFPSPTTAIRVRATGNVVGDWIHSYMIVPVLGEVAIDTVIPM